MNALYILSLAIIALSASCVSSFIQPLSSSFVPAIKAYDVIPTSTKLFESSPSNDNDIPKFIDNDSSVDSSSVSKVDEEEKPYPIDVPSPILLSLSMAFAIFSTGKSDKSLIKMIIKLF